MERIIIYPNTPEFELFEKLKPLMQEQMYEAFKAGFLIGYNEHGYTEERIKMFFAKYSINAEPLEVKHLTFKD